MADGPIDQTNGQEGLSLRPGTRLGHYEVLSCIGSGGMGEVYVARDHHLARDVAIKVLRRHILERPRARTDFRNEARALARLNHPNIATIHDFDSQDDIDFLVMEFVSGESLAARMKKGALPHREWTAIGRQICEALSVAHANGIVHRDLKPQNVFLDPWGHVKVLDFGLAKLAPDYIDSTVTTQRESETGRILGTPPYMAPEQLRGARVDHRTDIYALGVTLYELATGRRAFEAPTRAELIVCILEHSPEHPRKLRPDLSEELEKTIVRAMQRDPKDRHQSAEEVRVELLPSMEKKVNVAGIARAVFWIGALLMLLLAGRWLQGRNEFEWVAPQLTKIVRDPVPADDGDMALAPNALWMSYTVHGPYGETLWRAALAGGSPEELLEVSGAIARHCWSTDSRQIAIIGEQGEHRYLQLVPAFGDAPGAPIDLPEEIGWPISVAWHDNTIFVAGYTSGLWSYGLEDGVFRHQLLGASDDYKYMDYDVCGHGEHVLISARSEGRSTLVLRRLDSDSEKALHIEGKNAIWGDDTCTTIVYAKEDGGRDEIWIADLESNRSHALTLGSELKLPIAASGDGRTLIYQSQSDSGTLWCRTTAENAELVPISDNQREYRWPSGQTGTDRIIFQRIPVNAGGPVAFFASEVAIGRIADGRLADVQALVAEAGMPLLSSDGEWISYITNMSQGFNLCVTRTSTLQSTLVSASVVIPDFHAYPFEPLEDFVAWNPVRVELYYVADRGDSTQMIGMWTPTATSTLHVTESSAIRLSDLHASHDGRTLGWAEHDTESGQWAVRCMDLLQQSTKIVFQRRAMASPSDRLLVRGQRADGSLLVAEVRHSAAAGMSEDVILWAIHPETGPSEVGRLEFAYSGTLRYDSKNDGLYYTGLSEDLSHQLRYHDLRSGRDSVIKKEYSENVTFGAVALTADGSLLCVRHETSTQYNLLRFTEDPLARGR